jgi:hypothetical protein
MGTSAQGDSGVKGTPKEPTTFEKFKEALIGFVKNFNAEEEIKPVPNAEPKPAEPVQASEPTEPKASTDRVAALEAENRALKAREAQQTEESKKANERISALEDSGHRSAFREIVTGEGNIENRWTGDTEKHINHMMALRKAFGQDSDELKHYIATQRAHVSAINSAGIFTERGSEFEGAEPDVEEGTPQGAYSQLRKIAREDPDFIADKITMEQAFVRAGEKNPELKKKYREQFRSRNTVR